MLLLVWNLDNYYVTWRPRHNLRMFKQCQKERLLSYRVPNLVYDARKLRSNRPKNE